jgi:MFS family permease
VDALTFFVPALAVSFLAIPGSHRANMPQQTQHIKQEWHDGLALVREHADIRLTFVLLGSAALQIASLSVLGILLAKEKLGANVSAFGAMMSFMGMGMLVGAVANRLGSDLSHLRRASIGSVITGGGMVLLACLSSMPLMMACCWLIGLGFVTVQIHAQTILQSTPQGLRGRALGMGQAVTGSVTFLAAALIGLLAEQIGVPLVAVAIGLTAVGVGGIMLRFRLKGA